MRHDPPVPVARELVVGIRRLPGRRWSRARRYELRFRNGGAASCDLARLDVMLDARQYPADFWATVSAADDAYRRGDEQTVIEWGGREIEGVDPEAGHETLRHRHGWIESSRGYRVRATGRAGLDYGDLDGELHINSEMMATPAVVIYTDSIPDNRSCVLERVMRAWLWAGLDVDIEPPRPL